MLGTMYFWNKFQFCSSMPTYSCLPVTCTCTWTSSSLQENLQTGKNTDHKLLLVECIQLLSTVYLILRVSLKYLFLSWSISKNSPPSAENKQTTENSVDYEMQPTCNRMPDAIQYQTRNFLHVNIDLFLHVITFQQ